MQFASWNYYDSIFGTISTLPHLFAGVAGNLWSTYGDDNKSIRTDHPIIVFGVDAEEHFAKCIDLWHHTSTYTNMMYYMMESIKYLVIVVECAICSFSFFSLL